VVRESIHESLSREAEFNVVGEASDGEEAVRMAQKLVPDVILMDISMPVLNGIEATRQIKSRLPATRVIALSGYEEEDLAEAMRAAGADGYLKKTVRAQALIDAILETPAMMA